MSTQAGPDAGAYVVRRGYRVLVGPAVLLLAGVLIQVFHPGGVSGFAIVFWVLGLLLLLRTLQRRLVGQLRFAVDAEGVYLAPDGAAKQAERVPWSAISAVVYFSRRVQVFARVTYIGYVGLEDATGRVFTARRVVGWQLDVPRLTAATARFGGDRPVRQASDQVG